MDPIAIPTLQLRHVVPVDPADARLEVCRDLLTDQSFGPAAELHIGEATGVCGEHDVKPVRVWVFVSAVGAVWVRTDWKERIVRLRQIGTEEDALDDVHPLVAVLAAQVLE